MRLLLLAVAGGALGSGARYLVNVWAARSLGAGFPWSTLIVNVVGCAAMGILAEVVMHRLDGSPAWRAFLATGILGGFTTFSAFALDFAALTRTGELAPALIYVALSVALSLAGVFAGLAIGRALI